MKLQNVQYYGIYIYEKNVQYFRPPSFNFQNCDHNYLNKIGVTFLHLQVYQYHDPC